jgi:hypothetical protein
LAKPSPQAADMRTKIMAIVIETTDSVVETGLKLCGRREGKTIQQFAEESLSCALTSCSYENDGEIGISSLTVR